MCVIILRPAEGHGLTREHLINCFVNNPDGWGIMYADGGRVITHRGMDLKGFFDVYDGLGDKNLGLHFRIKTHGNVDLRNTHPYEVLNMEEHGADLHLMHNGTIKIGEVDKTMSDTWHYINFELRPILSLAPAILGVEAFTDHVEARIGWSKLLLLDGDGKFTVVAEHKGKELLGCWFSNTHSHTAAANYGKHVGRGGWYGHYGDCEPADALPFDKGGAKAVATAGAKDGDVKQEVKFLRADAPAPQCACDPEREEYLEALRAELIEEGHVAERIEEELDRAGAEYDNVVSEPVAHKSNIVVLGDRKDDGDDDEEDYGPHDEVAFLVDQGYLSWEDIMDLSTREIDRLIREAPELVADFLLQNADILQTSRKTRTLVRQPHE